MMIPCRAAATKLVRQAVTSPATRRLCLSSSAAHSPSAVTFVPFTKSIFRCFSTEPVERADQQDGTQSQPTIDEMSSLLEGNEMERARAVLREKASGGKRLQHEDLRNVFNAAKTPKDARLIMGTLIKYKRKNKYVLTTEMAELAVKQILLADPLEGSILILRNFTAKSGLYYSCEVPVLDLVLDGVSNRIAEYWYEKEEVWSALVTTLQLLIYRKDRLDKKVPKKVAKKYNKQIQVQDGATAETVRKMVEIGLKFKTAQAVHKQIIEHCQRHGVPISDETRRIVDQARFQEQMTE